MTETPYRKLTPKRRSLAGSSQAWLAPDHLLIVNSNRFTERYQRFALTDIQAIVLADGPSAREAQLACAIASVAWFGLGYVVFGLSGVAFFGITAGIGLAFTIRSMARPPRCICAIETSVSRELLAPVWNRGIARRFVATIAQEIDAAQKSLPEREPEPSPLLDERPPVGRVNASESENSILNPLPPAIHGSRNYVAESFFGLLLVDALLMALVLGIPGNNLLGLMPMVYLCEASMALVVLFQKSARPATFPNGLVVLCLALLVADVFTVSGVAGFRAFEGSTQRPPVSGPFASLWLSSTRTLLVSSGWRVAGGLLGLTWLLVERRRRPKYTISEAR